MLLTIFKVAPRATSVAQFSMCISGKMLIGSIQSIAVDSIESNRLRCVFPNLNICTKGQNVFELN